MKIGLTPITYHQLRWLRKLARVGHAQRGRGRTGCSCMRNGWTKWSTLVTEPEASLDWNECLTLAGRDMLRQYRAIPLRDLRRP